MSSKRKKEELYNSDDDEDFVPNANELEDEKEVLMDENEEEILQPTPGKGKTKKSRQRVVAQKPKRRGPFDSEDEFSEEEVVEIPEEEEEPPAKKPKFEETHDTHLSSGASKAQVSNDDFFAAMMKGKAPSTTNSTSSTNTITKPPTTTSATTSQSNDKSDSLSFFQMMAAKSASKSSSPAPTTTPTDSKLGIPSSWLKSNGNDATPPATSTEATTTLTGPQTVTIKERYEFAGEKIEVERKVDVKEAEALQAKKATSGLGDLLDQLKGKSKITTLQKSKLDWNQFTETEGLADEFEKNRKDGYIQKQEFLQNAEAAETAAYIAGRAKATRR